MESKRFEITETEGSVKGFYVVVDKETGSMWIYVNTLDKKSRKIMLFF